ncbi:MULTISPECIES: zinc ABC transporter substrate-binding protein [unclassified Streptomyces]|uniref:metal ABC transporter solute-binding protein, Zn/Mn family n=1 Tax=unclassified Streptomyces TaxID=2593676 RepID=UPI001BAE771E|nr:MULTISPECIES: zinc ABC transporter substrate-binding protein [unclassified Streptomyces]MDH6447976.1 zinc/manganese transport system substrate-binding protein [Streptomyces sp. SAI-119]MDH6501302.1 zinc/manganese transport system substrate-binding protein [Streptomyces sp. SAI-149]QUC60250.1 zinc ABC transporter substrate-binding protein [Streptomyces sp. A2-16]
MSTSPSRRLALLVGASVALLAGCGSSSDSGNDGSAAAAPAGSSKVAVVASTNVYGDIVSRIGGDKVSVTSVISDPDQDPHSYEASTQNQLALSKAKVVVENGGGYDDFVDRMLKSAGNSSAEVINAVKVSGKSAPKGGELNEHVWYDFPTVARIADRMAAALGKADPANAAAYTRNAEAFKADLKPLEAKEAQIKKEHGGAAIAITEPVPLYMTAASGLVDKTPAEFSEAIEEGTDVSPKVLQEALALFTGKQVEALVYNEQTSGPQTEKSEQAAKAAGIPVVPVTETLPSGKDYLSWMTGNVDALANALAK